MCEIIQPDSCDVNGVGKSQKYFRLNSRTSMQDRYKVRLKTWNIETLTGWNRELAEDLRRRSTNICNVQKHKAEKGESKRNWRGV